MGRELCMSLTSVVLEAINTVEQDKTNFHSMSGHHQQQQRPLQRNDHNDQSRSGEKKRPSSERFSRRPHTAEPNQHRTVQPQRPRAASGARARADSAGNGLSHHRRVAGREKLGSPAGAGGDGCGGQNEEDEGLADLDRREEEFRKASEGGAVSSFYVAEGCVFVRLTGFVIW